MTYTPCVRSRRHLLRRAMIPIACAGMALGCPREPEAYRGRGLRVDTLPVNDVVRVYRAALGGSFSLDDPSLSLLVDPVLLPRGMGLAGGDSMPPAVRSAPHRQRLAHGARQAPAPR